MQRSRRELFWRRMRTRLGRERCRAESVRLLAHELKAPLGVVEGYLTMLLESQTIDAARLRHVLSRSVERLRGMRQLIVELLDLARLCGGSPRELCAVDVAEVARECMLSLEPEAQARGISCKLDSTPTLTLLAVRAEIEMVLCNLLSNAIKYNRPGGEVNVRLRRRPNAIEIAVEDTGIGLTVQEAAKLFNDFARVRNAKTRGIEGSGLGLATVKRIATMYHGTATVASQPDRGSTFTVTLEAVMPETKAP